MSYTPYLIFLRYKVKILGQNLVDGLSYFLWYGTEQSILTYLYLTLKSSPIVVSDFHTAIESKV